MSTYLSRLDLELMSSGRSNEVVFESLCKFYYESTYALIRILTFGFPSKVHSVNRFKFFFKNWYDFSFYLCKQYGIL